MRLKSDMPIYKCARTYDQTTVPRGSVREETCTQHVLTLCGRFVQISTKQANNCYAIVG